MAYIDDWTDEQLAELERKLRKIYENAAKELKDCVDAYWQDFREQDEMMRKKLERGEISEKRYQKWRREMLLDGKINEDMRDLLSANLTQINKDAAGVINGVTPLVFSENHNYEAFGFEKEYGNLSFTLYNQNAVLRLIRDDPQLLPTMPNPLQVDVERDKRWNMKKISDVITSGILIGKSVDRIADDLQSVVGMQQSAAIRNARTATTSAQNGGRQAAFEHAAEMGVDVKKRWVATKDMRTRPSHASMDGVVVAYNDNFVTPLGSVMRFPGDPSGKPADVYNCRCAMRTVDSLVKPSKMRVRDPATEKNVLVEEMTYSEWKGWAKKRENNA